MPVDYKIILGVLATVIGFIGYFPYIRDTLKGKTKPHVFSWFLWSLMEAIVFFAQISEGAGIGAAVTGTAAGITLFIAILAWRSEDKQITPWDWAAFVGALIGVVLWRITHDPLLAVIFVSLADALAYAPTYRKAWHRPEEETLIEYGLSVVKWAIAIFALQSLNLTTWLYPATLIFTNTLFVTISLIRKRQLRDKIKLPLNL